jgi:hypothetical protein
MIEFFFFVEVPSDRDLCPEFSQQDPDWVQDHQISSYTLNSLNTGTSFFV